MKVFVSHKDVDRERATQVAATLRLSGHEVYLDVIDAQIAKSGDDLSAYLRARMAECDSLIAVISKATQESWWVPWEIGVATEREYPLSTYQSDTTAPPEYLKKWPVLRSLGDLKEFATLLAGFETRVRRVALAERKTFEQARVKGVAEFHRDLKKAINQT